jgi:spermidine synthase
MIVERVQTERGELVLRETDGRWEIISNGVFLMDTSDGSSERLLVDAAVSACASAAPRMLIGGLGVGFSLTAAVAYKRLAAIDVVEIEPAIIGWHHRHLRHLSGPALQDPRVRVIAADLAEWLRRQPDRYDVICLDIDNGPNWLVFEANAAVYDDAGLDLAGRRLLAGGVLAIWSASRDGAFEKRLGARFAAVRTLEVERDRGAPDVVYLASGLRRGPTLEP